MIKKANKNPREFVVARYTRPNESFPTKLDVAVNGHVGVLEEGRNCILPMFLVESAKESHQFVHRPRLNTGAEDNDTYETKKVHPVVDTYPISEDYQSPDGIRKLLELSKQETDETSEFFRLRLGVKELVYGDMGAAERAATEAVAKGKKVIADSDNLAKLIVEKDLKIAEQEKRIESMESKMDKMMSMMEKSLSSSESASEKQVFEFDGKTYKTEAAMKAAMTKAEKAKEDEEEPIKVDA